MGGVRLLTRWRVIRARADSFCHGLERGDDLVGAAVATLTGVEDIALHLADLEPGAISVDDQGGVSMIAEQQKKMTVTAIVVLDRPTWQIGQAGNDVNGLCL